MATQTIPELEDVLQMGRGPPPGLHGFLGDLQLHRISARGQQHRRRLGPRQWP